ncbi:E1-E2 ATPase-domain-containing protein [Mycotypha africana]|uniref:E1-E2 ATPase-domain-containing protein n=1 Tax=Mycotypha africana TaxID=64632 RepID=UPI0023003FAE|nr:E1-E2 ATPase-domain-containing protein [Mycotypha africana]KAI8970249.1 E1-E2 ATPase-domain-containing protein [Mycotypha africana]
MTEVTVKVKIMNMTCEHCVRSVTKALQQVPEVKGASVRVNLKQEEATFTIEDMSRKLELLHKISEAVEEAGYDCGEFQFIPITDSATNAEADIITIPIDGMTCSHCTNTITNALKQVPEIDPESVHVSLEKAQAQMSLTVPRESFNLTKVTELIEDLGYMVGEEFNSTEANSPPKMVSDNDTLTNIKSIEVYLSGLTCQHCSRTVTSAIQSLPGVLRDSVIVNEKTQKCSFSYEDEAINEKMLRRLIEDLGYDMVGRPKITKGIYTKEPSSNSSCETLEEVVTGETLLDDENEQRKVVMRVIGMTCKSCVKSVTEALENDLPHVLPHSIFVGLQTEMATFITTKPDVEKIRDVIETKGFSVENIQIIRNLKSPAVLGLEDEKCEKNYKMDSSLESVSIGQVEVVAVPHKVSLQIGGMTCSSCVRTVEQGLAKLPGVVPSSTKVNLLTRNATLSVEGGNLDEQTIIKAVEKMGYSASNVVFLSEATQPTKSAKAGNDVYKAEVVVSGMHCAECVQKLHNSFSTLHGIKSDTIVIDLKSGQSSFEFTGDYISRQRIQQSVLQVGLSTESIKITKLISKSNDAASISNSDDEEHSTAYLNVTGMTCASCVATIERNLMKQPGVISCQVNLLTKLAIIKYDSTIVGSRVLAQMIEQLGYKAELTQSAQNASLTEQREAMRNTMNQELKVLQKRFLWSLLFAVPVVLISMIFMMALPPSSPVHRAFTKEITSGLSIGDLILFILSTPVQFWLGLPFYVKAYKSLVYSHSANMETLVAMGTTVAYLASVASVIAAMVRRSMSMTMNYFETSVLLITFIHFGKWLEALAKGKTAETISKLMDLQPDKAVLIEFKKETDLNETFTEEINQDSYVEREIDSTDIQVGDILKVKAGERIPCDGKVWRGTSNADESMITGESLPIAKKPGDRVICATINLSAPIYFRAMRVGSDTTLSRIIQLVQDAQSSPKAPIEHLADKISSVFVPVVIALAIITFIIWEVVSLKNLYPDEWLPMGENKTIFSLLLAVTVLVIACPCGLGLASPTAVMVGTGVAAKNGILVKGGGNALEMASKLTTIAFDKTGTLTLGKPVVTHAWTSISMKEQSDVELTTKKKIAIWKILGRVASASNHPLSRAIVKKAKFIIKSLLEDPTISDDKLIFNDIAPGDVEDDSNADEKSADSTDYFDGVKISNAEEVAGRGLLVTLTLGTQVSQYLEGNLKDVQAINVFSGSEDWMNQNHARYKNSREAKACRNLLMEWQNLGQSTVIIAASPLSNGNVHDDDLLSESDLHKDNDNCKNQCVCDICKCVANSICCTASKTMVIAQVSIADIPRPETVTLIEELKRRKVEVWMITGDNERTAKAMGQRLGFPAENVLSNVKPEQKADRIRNLQRKVFNAKERKTGGTHSWKKLRAQGQRTVVAMVGDGINDSPALAQADLGISVGSATDIAIEAASIVLIRNNLLDLLTMYDLARTVVRRIRFNFLWAFIYNTVAIPIAAGILYPIVGQGLPPYIAGIAMVASSISVVCSSLLLRLYKPPKIAADSHQIKL